MTEEQVVNVGGGEEISENGDDQHKIKAEYCNGVPHAKEEENGNVGGKVVGGGSDASADKFAGGEAVTDSDASDLVIVADGNGASEEHKVDGEAIGESHATVSEGECEWEVVSNKEEKDCADSSAESNGSAAAAEVIPETATADVVSRESESECAEGQNGTRSVAVSEDKNNKDVTDTVVEGCNEFESAIGASDVQNGVTDSDTVVEEGVADQGHEFESVVAGASDVQNGALDKELSECSVENGIGGVVNVDGVQEFENTSGTEVPGDEKDVVVEEVADLNKSDQGLESVVVQNAEENEVPVVVEGVTVTAKEVESVESGGGEEKEGGSDDVQGGSETVSYKDIVSKSLAGAGDVQNGLADIVSSECMEKNEIAINVDADGVSATRDVKECAGEDAQNSLEKAEVESVSDIVVDKSIAVADVQNGEDAQNSLEKAQVESVSDIVVDKSIAVADVQNGLAEPELSECPEENEIPTEGEPSSKLERSEEDSGHELVAEGENLSALDSTDMIGDGNVVSDMNGNAVESKDEASVYVSEIKNNVVESEDEPSKNVVLSEVDISNMKTDAVQNEAEPSNEAVESGDEPSNNVVQSEVDISNMKTNAVENGAEPSNKAVESEDEPLNNAVQSEVDISNMKTKAVENEAEPSNKAVESEAVERELSVRDESSSHGDAQEGSTTENLDGQNTGTEVVKSPFYYLIKLPRYDDDENMKEEINNAFRQVDEKTKIRDAIRNEIQTIKASCKECTEGFRAAKSAERAARDLLRSKRQEMDAVQSTVSRLNNVISVGDIDGQIRNMEYKIQHETLDLKEEKQLIRQIKQLKQNREELSSNMGKQDQSQQSLDNRDSIGEHSKHLQLLKKELELLKSNVQKSEAATKAARKKSDDENKKMSEVLARYRAADDIRQEAYAKLQALKKQLHEKSKYFWEYKNAARKAQELAAEGKKEELQRLCVDEVERIHELLKKNDEFRRDYARCNTGSTLRRLQTLDGRSRGRDEEPPVIPNAFAERASRNNSLAVVSQSTLEQEKKSISTESVNIKNEPVSKDVVQRTETSQTTKAKKPAKSAPLEKPVVARWGDESDEDTREEPVRTKEEEELILKAEKARKEEEAAKLKEMRRLEEIEKAKEAMERKKRNAEKAQQRAALKAQKEAEEREKKREKRAKKKERRTSASADTADNTQQECAPSLETQTTITEECDQSEKPAEVTKRPQKPSHFTRLTRIKSSLPMPLRNRGRRRIQPWMWVLIAVLVAVAMLFVGNSSSLRSSLPRFGF